MKLVVLAVAALVLFYLITDPVGAAATTNGGLGMLEDGANQIFVFVRTLFGV